MIFFISIFFCVVEYYFLDFFVNISSIVGGQQYPQGQQGYPQQNQSRQVQVSGGQGGGQRGQGGASQHSYQQGQSAQYNPEYAGNSNAISGK